MLPWMFSIYYADYLNLDLKDKVVFKGEGDAMITPVELDQDAIHEQNEKRRE